MAPVQITNPPGLPDPVGNYSHVAIDSVTGLIAVAGQLGVDRQTGLLPASAAQQCASAVRNAISAVVAAGGSAGTILKLTAYLVDKAHIPAYRVARDEVFEEFGVTPPPPQVLLVIASLGSDEHLVEVDVMAVLNRTRADLL